MSSHYVDLHCHLDLYEDFVSAVSKAEKAEVFTLTVTTTPKAWPRNRELTESTSFVRAALGLHPQLIHERADEISLWEEYPPQTRYVGEVGLDAGPLYFRSLDLQKEIFGHVLQLDRPRPVSFRATFHQLVGQARLARRRLVLVASKHSFPIPQVWSKPR
jgi:TatD DNase family protein